VTFVRSKILVELKEVVSMLAILLGGFKIFKTAITENPIAMNIKSKKN